MDANLLHIRGSWVEKYYLTLVTDTTQVYFAKSIPRELFYAQSIAFSNHIELKQSKKMLFQNLTMIFCLREKEYFFD